MAKCDKNFGKLFAKYFNLLNELFKFVALHSSLMSGFSPGLTMHAKVADFHPFLVFIRMRWPDWLIFEGYDSVKNETKALKHSQWQYHSTIR